VAEQITAASGPGLCKNGASVGVAREHDITVVVRIGLRWTQQLGIH
jgi:hypothetical protein